MRLLRRALVLALWLPIGLAAQSAAQPAARRPITQDDYDRWRSIVQPTLSPDGRWAVYTLTPTVGDGILVARATVGVTEHRVARGWTGRPLMSVTGTPFSPQAAQVTGDSKFVLFLRYPAKAAMDSARARRARPADQPKNALGILALADGAVTTIDRVRGFKVARDGGRYVAYQLEADSAAAPRGGATRGAERGADSATTPAKKKDAGAPLVLRELATGTEVRIEGVTDYVLDRGEKWLVYAVAGADSLKVDGVYARHLATGTVTPLKQGTGNYRALALDETGAQAAFVTDADEWTATTPRMALYHATLAAPKPLAATLAVAAGAVGDSLRVSDRGVEFVRAGGVVRFGIAHVLPDSIPADSLAERAVVDLWHWRDARPQPMQKLQAAQDRTRSLPATYTVATRQMRRLGSDSIPTVTLADDGRLGLAVTDVPYEMDAIAGDDAADVYLITTATGAMRRVATRIRHGASLSPAAKYVAWFADSSWLVHDVATGRVRDLTAAIPRVRFDQETHDTPDRPSPWGIAGWTTGDARVLIYDRYDVWEVDPAGLVAPRNLTDGVGRAEQLTFRVVDLDDDRRAIDPAQPLLLRTFDNVTKQAGFYRDRVGATALPARIVMAPKSWPVLVKARKAEQYLVARADYREYPDLWTGPALDAVTRISNAMPEQAQYRWGDVELVKWTNADGVPMEGLLYTPEGFDP
ncbi:MAG: hypothetical protein RL139_805, partial [Gemmatimonadota bacterium]